MGSAPPLFILDFQVTFSYGDDLLNSLGLLNWVQYNMIFLDSLGSTQLIGFIFILLMLLHDEIQCEYFPKGSTIIIQQ